MPLRFTCVPVLHCRHKGFAFVEFVSIADAAAAVVCHASPSSEVVCEVVPYSDGDVEVGTAPVFDGADAVPAAAPAVPDSSGTGLLQLAHGAAAKLSNFKSGVAAASGQSKLNLQSGADPGHPLKLG